MTTLLRQHDCDTTGPLRARVARVACLEGDLCDIVAKCRMSQMSQPFPVVAPLQQTIARPWPRLAVVQEAGLMGEAKRRRAYHTLDGGAPSDDRIMLLIDVFDVFDALRKTDLVRLSAIVEVHKRAHRRPAPLCSACDYEFGYGEAPAAMYCTRPMFPKGDAFTFIAGAICPRCADRRPDELVAAIVGYLRKIKPDAAIVEAGRA